MQVAATASPLHEPCRRASLGHRQEIGGWQCERKFPAETVAVLGMCTHVVYQKTKLGDGKRNYIDEFGEEASGIKPAHCIDADGHPLLAGGRYVVEHHGIVN